MNATLIRIGIVLASTAGACAAEPQMRVAASRDLKVAVVDLNRSSEARDRMHQAFASGLSASLTDQCGGPVGVAAKRVGVDQAVSNLTAGTYDAALVIGRDVPMPLRRVGAMVLSAASDNGKRGFYLIIANDDASLQGLLATAFTRTLNDETFQQRLSIAEGKAPAPVAGEKIAAAQ